MSAALPEGGRRRDDIARIRMNGAIAKVAGSAGRMTYRRSPVGQQMVERSLPKDANTASQRASRMDFTKGSDGWRALAKSSQSAWNSAAKGKKRRDDVTGEMYALQGRALYIGRASKLAQVSPGASLNIVPPIVPFAGDSLNFAIQLSGMSAVVRTDRANAASATTEFLVQRLPSPDRAPTRGDYVTYGFHKFTGSPVDTYAIGLGPGLWSIAAQYVCPTSGEETGFQELGIQAVTLSLVEGGSEEGATDEAAKAA